MLTKINNLLVASAIALTSVTLSAAELFRLNQKVTGFVNYNSSSVVLVSETGTLYSIENLKLQQKGNYQVDAGCNLKTQNPSSMDGSEGGMTLAYPYFVGLGKVCRIDEAQKRIVLVSDFRKQLPQNTFTLSYAGSDTNSVYFVMNGRVYPDADTGYIFSIAINKATHSVSMKPFITEVPGFSAAMIYDQKQLSITTWMQTNQIYKIDATNLISLLQSGKVYRFASIATQTTNDFDGLSSFALKNDSDFLFYNSEYESYRINTATKTPTPQVFKHSCEPISGHKNQWLLLCNANTVVLE